MYTMENGFEMNDEMAAFLQEHARIGSTGSHDLAG